jgi:hypothetical protein
MAITNYAHGDTSLALLRVFLYSGPGIRLVRNAFDARSQLAATRLQTVGMGLPTSPRP